VQKVALEIPPGELVKVIEPILKEYLENGDMQEVLVSIFYYIFNKWGHRGALNWYRDGPQIITTWVRILSWAYLKGVSSLISLPLEIAQPI